MNSPTPKTITGRARVRKTRWTVAWMDRFARVLIAAGGIGTIIAVTTVFLFLASVVFWLFVPASVDSPQTTSAPIPSSRPLCMACDEDQTTAWALSADGMVTAFRLDNGATLSRGPLRKEEGPKLTAAGFSQSGERGIFGFADGSVRLGKIGFKSEFLPIDEVPDPLRRLKKNELAELNGAMVKRAADDLFHRSQSVVELESPIETTHSSPIHKIAILERSEGPLFCALSADGMLSLNGVTARKNLLTKKTTFTTEGGSVHLPSGRKEPPDYLLISGSGNSVFVAWKDGRLLRYDTRDIAKPVLKEDVKLVPESGQALTALTMLLGGETLLAGDSVGRVRAWFSVKPNEGRGENRLVMAHDLVGPSAAVTCLATNPRQRICAVGYADGSARLFSITNEKLLADVRAAERDPVFDVMLSPNGNGLFAATSAGLTQWRLELRHPEVSLATLFGTVWYEGYPEPARAWQTTGGTDAAEMKANLVPLIFGTLKATFYSMLFGAPLALMAAVFSSEFLHPRTKARVKPLIEMMASLPSVVLGFLAGIVFAKMIERVVPEVLATLFTTPLAFMTGAYLWHFLPRNFAIRYQRAKLACIALLLPVGIFAGWSLGPFLEAWLFAGDLKAWLNNPGKEQYADGMGGWVLLLLPLAGLAAALIVSRIVSPVVRAHTRDLSRSRLVAIEFGKFIGGCAFAVLTALLVAAFLTHVFGIDPRDPEPGQQHLGLRLYPLSGYIQRNALILGVMMGFAIIPIIYTIAEDALSSVPQHLRGASLGAGATPWQTAVRIVIPTAMSGLFSALMIGLGRAVGETMIVLMAAGNTSIMELNIFNGFQTLSAAIATELSEAPAGSTHFRILFLAGLTLFVMTFIINSIAEVVRQRFRRRFHEL